MKRIHIALLSCVLATAFMGGIIIGQILDSRKVEAASDTGRFQGVTTGDDGTIWIVDTLTGQIEKKAIHYDDKERKNVIVTRARSTNRPVD